MDGLPVEIPDSRPIWDFVGSGRLLTNGQIATYLEKPDGPVGPTDVDILNRVLIWSESSNREIKNVLREVTPFPLVRESLMSLRSFACTMIISATPRATLFREWDSAGLLEFVNAVGGQEDGPKGRQLERALEQGYTPERALLIGDAPGDHTAAVENGILFFPILPGQEEASWHQFITVGLHRFRDGSFKGEYQDSLTGEYYRFLDGL